MENKLLYKDLFDRTKTCVIIPTYNNSTTLARLIDDVLQYTNNVIIVNDGSTDDTAAVLKAYGHLEIINSGKNEGKGKAIIRGLRHAREKAFEHAVTIDSDGQHFAEDLPKFAAKIEKEPDTMVIGARNMSQDGIPLKSSFGKKFSNFWVWIETGLKIPDTQSGFRLYPLRYTEKMKFFSAKYEFEIEILTRLAWKGVRISAVPVRVLYLPKDKRVSHFRPFLDFVRISMLNTCLVTIALLYARPFNFIKKLNRKNIRSFIKNDILNPNESNFRKALAVTLGIFMGITPIWGYQLITAILLAHLLKLNKAIVIVTANISLPPLIPLILWVSFKTGALILGSNASHFSFSNGINFSMIKDNLIQYVIGSLCFGFFFSILCGLLTLITLQYLRRNKPIHIY